MFCCGLGFRPLRAKSSRLMESFCSTLSSAMLLLLLLLLMLLLLLLLLRLLLLLLLLLQLCLTERLKQRPEQDKWCWGPE